MKYHYLLNTEYFPVLRVLSALKVAKKMFSKTQKSTENYQGSPYGVLKELRMIIAYVSANAYVNSKNKNISFRNSL